MKIRLIPIALLLMLPAMTYGAPRKRAAAVNPEEVLEQAREAFAAYNTELAQEKIAKLRTVKNLPDEEAVDMLESQVDRMESMMQRVDAIEVIDSLTVSRADFFSNYRLSSAAGYILSPDDLENSFSAAEGSTVYMTENGNIMIWATDEGLAESHKLTDGTWEQASMLGDALNAGGTASFPFLMPDGITLYYATDGEDSLGGYDIYVSRRNGEEFPAPQNLGMPYNSPYDDFLLVIDEETGAGWFASDRNSPGGDVTIYVFVPSETRVNVDVDDPNLASRARLSDISLTQTDKDYSGLLSRINSIDPGAGAADNTPDFEFVMPDGRVLTRWDQLRSERGRRLMENYIDSLADFQAEEQNLENLRLQYGRGNKNVASTILKIEKQLKTSEEQLKSMSNRIIEAESK
ncbi:MAG: hypothetical protein HDS64_09145 [Bacteroidales bacterium]|nr:hypothetical protein [Bacteroidales bacterium]